MTGEVFFAVFCAAITLVLLVAYAIARDEWMNKS
jgi:hypothetical protein